MRSYLYSVITGEQKGFIPAILRMFLLAASAVYGGLIRFILLGYSSGFLKNEKLAVPVISVGNITWGGVGKTPLVLWMVQYLRGRNVHPAILTRGYSLKKTETQSRSIDSDEVQLFLQSFPDVPVLVGRDRLKSAREFLKSRSADGFILDDGFQHWRIHRDLNIVAIDSVNPWGNGFLIPRGILREPLSSLARADVFVLTKTDLGKNNLSSIKSKLCDLNPRALIVETVHRAIGIEDFFEMGRPLPVSILQGKTVGAFCGIGEPDSFFAMLSFLKADVVLRKKFLDHHPYVRDDITDLLAEAKNKGTSLLLTTEKDAVKLKPFRELFEPDCRLLILKIDIAIIQGEKEFCGRISDLFIS